MHAATARDHELFKQVSRRITSKWIEDPPDIGGMTGGFGAGGGGAGLGAGGTGGVVAPPLINRDMIIEPIIWD